jgi:hypothetical protein
MNTDAKEYLDFLYDHKAAAVQETARLNYDTGNDIEDPIKREVALAVHAVKVAAAKDTVSLIDQIIKNYIYT